jgi:endoglucanase
MHNEKFVMTKAWDNRFGCALAIEVLRRLKNDAHPNVVYGVGTVQEEVGLRGAVTSTNLIEPDIGFALDTGIAGDIPGVGPDEAAGKLGQGPVILIYDGSLIPHTGLRNLVLDVAEAEGIPIQFDRVAGGGTDAGRIHLAGAGVPSLAVGVAVRYIHSHAAILHRDDFDQAARLMTAVIKRLDQETVEQLKG